jgi:hypothetical protein
MTPFLIEMGHPSLVIRRTWAARPVFRGFAAKFGVLSQRLFSGADEYRKGVRARDKVKIKGMRSSGRAGGGRFREPELTWQSPMRQRNSDVLILVLILMRSW